MRVLLLFTIVTILHIVLLLHDDFCRTRQGYFYEEPENDSLIYISSLVVNTRMADDESLQEMVIYLANRHPTAIISFDERTAGYLHVINIKRQFVASVIYCEDKAVKINTRPLLNLLDSLHLRKANVPNVIYANSSGLLASTNIYVEAEQVMDVDIRNRIIVLARTSIDYQPEFHDASISFETKDVIRLLNERNVLLFDYQLFLSALFTILNERFVSDAPFGLMLGCVLIIFSLHCLIGLLVNNGNSSLRRKYAFYKIYQLLMFAMSLVLHALLFSIGWVNNVYILWSAIVIGGEIFFWGFYAEILGKKG